MRTIVAGLCLVVLGSISARAAPCDGLTPASARAAALTANIEVAGTKIKPDQVSDIYQIGDECRVTLVTTLDNGHWRHAEFAITKNGDKAALAPIKGPADDAPASRDFH